jgi:hypothetical protein
MSTMKTYKVAVFLNNNRCRLFEIDAFGPQEAEVRALRGIRARNVVRIRTEVDVLKTSARERRQLLWQKSNAWNESPQTV